MLDLRTSLPTGSEAARRAEAFLRERQMAQAAEVLVITGRGNNSADGVAVVRPVVAGVLARLRRVGVVAGWQEHSPGSFVVTPAPIKALFEAPPRHGHQVTPAVVAPQEFAGLSPETRTALHDLAVRALQGLGVPTDERFVLDEMQRQFAALGRAVGSGRDREERLRTAARQALDEMNDAE